MDKVEITKQITFGGKLTLNETELRALEALVGYGTKEFLEVFYKNLGSHYLKPHEEGVISLFKTIKEQVRPQIHAIDKARKSMHEVMKEKTV